MGCNPATGATIQIAASKKVAFRAAKELKAAVRGRLSSSRRYSSMQVGPADPVPAP
jgi:Bacterial DNA-binding protein